MQLNSGNTNIIVAVVIVLVIIAIGIAVYASRRKSRSAALRTHFGPEYDRTVRDSGSERSAEARLAERATRVNQFRIRALSPAEHQRFITDWQSIQARFVDHPRGAVIEADDLVSSLMQTRGYPVADFDQRAADVSVNHPQLVENYRAAHQVALRLGDNQATTEDMRNAMIHYRSLVDELLEAAPVAESGVVA